MNQNERGKSKEEFKCQLINSVMIPGYIERYRSELSEKILKTVDQCQKLVFL